MWPECGLQAFFCQCQAPNVYRDRYATDLAFELWKWMCGSGLEIAYHETAPGVLVYWITETWNDPLNNFWTKPRHVLSTYTLMSGVQATFREHPKTAGNTHCFTDIHVDFLLLLVVVSQVWWPCRISWITIWIDDIKFASPLIRPGSVEEESRTASSFAAGGQGVCRVSRTFSHASRMPQIYQHMPLPWPWGNEFGTWYLSTWCFELDRGDPGDHSRPLGTLNIISFLYIFQQIEQAHPQTYC